MYRATKRLSIVVHITSKKVDLTFLSQILCIYETLRSFVWFTPRCDRTKKHFAGASQNPCLKDALEVNPGRSAASKSNPRGAKLGRTKAYGAGGSPATESMDGDWREGGGARPDLTRNSTRPAPAAGGSRGPQAQRPPRSAKVAMLNQLSRDGGE